MRKFLLTKLGAFLLGFFTFLILWYSFLAIRAWAGTDGAKCRQAQDGSWVCTLPTTPRYDVTYSRQQVRVIRVPAHGPLIIVYQVQQPGQ